MENIKASVDRTLRKIFAIQNTKNQIKKPRIRCTAGVLVIDSTNRVLLQCRGDDGNWGIPGGGLEFGETLEEAAIRELFEETGITVDAMELLNVYSGRDQYHKYPDGNEFYCVSAVYISREYHGETRIDGIESRDLRFFSIDELPINITSSNIPMLKDLYIKIKSV